MRLDIGKSYLISDKLKKAFGTVEDEARIVSISSGIIILQINMQSFPLKESIAHENLFEKKVLSARYEEEIIVYDDFNVVIEPVEKPVEPEVVVEPEIEEPIQEEPEVVVEPEEVEEPVQEEPEPVVEPEIVEPEINNEEKQETIEEKPEDNNESEETVITIKPEPVEPESEPIDIWADYDPESDDFF